MITRLKNYKAAKLKNSDIIVYPWNEVPLRIRDIGWIEYIDYIPVINHLNIKKNEKKKIIQKQVTPWQTELW